MKILQELFGNGLLSEDKKRDLQKEMQATGKTEEEVVLSHKIIAEDSLFEMKSRLLRMPLKKIKPEDVPADVLEIIPEEAAVNYKMMPLAKAGDTVEVGMVYPEDISAQNALRFLANQEKYSYKVFLISFATLDGLLKQRKSISMETKKALEELNKEGGEQDNLVINKNVDVKVMAEDAPIIKMVVVILRHALENRASDIHIEPGRDKLNIRFRIDGVLHPSLFLPLKVHPSVVARIKILSGLKIDENRVPQDGRFSAKINGKDIDFRVATFPTLHGEKVELRVLDPSKGLKSFDELGLTGRNLEVVKEAIKKPFGLVFFTGPTGSGKTTTQYAILRILNKDSVNIVTVEDPIEYSIAGVNQSQVRPEIGYTFAQGLRQILRQDPNIIMVGEVRDEETVNLVMNAALTGHIVLSTLHTNSAVGVVPRLVDMGVRPFLIPSTLRVVISQRLVRTLCSKCKIKAKPSAEMAEYLAKKIKTMPEAAKKEIKNYDINAVYKAKGCDECGMTGYAGRAGLFEVLQMTEEVGALILRGAPEIEIFKTAQKQGMLTMEQEGVVKVLNGETTVEEIARVAEETE